MAHFCGAIRRNHLLIYLKEIFVLYFLASFEKTVILPSISNFMDTPPPSIMEMEIDDTEATFSPFTFQEIKTFDQPWFEILDMDKFNSIVTDKSEVATLGDIPEHNIDTPAEDSTRAGVTTSKLVACTVCKKMQY